MKKIHRFIGNFNLKAGNFKIQDKEIFNQFRNVLKLRIGERLILSDGNMNEAEAQIRGYGKDAIELEIIKVYQNVNEPEKKVILYCAILKRENFELVVQKATEVGVMEIVPIVTEHTIKLNVRPDRLEKIIREASEQSDRGIVPILNKPIDFEKAVEAANKNSLNILLDKTGESFGRLERLGNVGLIGIWIGPEGGWADKEIELARRSDFKIINLGKLTLRAETAAIVGSYLAIHNL